MHHRRQLSPRLAGAFGQRFQGNVLVGQGTRACGRVLVALLLATACTTPAPVAEDPGAARGSSAYGDKGAPYWSDLSLSWSTLTEIENWLRSSAAQRDPYWRVQGELTLAEGRLSLANQDSRQPKVDVVAIENRRKAARDGFQRVLDDPDSIAEQRVRARRGLANAAVVEPDIAPRDPSGLVARRQWGAESEVASRLNPVGQGWRKITIHHSAEIPGFTLNGSYDNSVTALRKIQRYHIHEQGWGDIGYHYLIDESGRVFEGRSDRWQGAHAGGNANVANLGICLLGDFRTHQPTPAALASLQHLVDDLRAENRIAREAVLPHEDLKNTECPGKYLASWVRSYSRGNLAASTNVIGTGTRPASSSVSNRTATNSGPSGSVR